MTLNSTKFHLVRGRGTGAEEWCVQEVWSEHDLKLPRGAPLHHVSGAWGLIGVRGTQRSEFRYALSGEAPLRSIACTCWRMGRPWAWRKLPTAIPTGLVSVVGPGHDLKRPFSSGDCVSSRRSVGPGHDLETACGDCVSSRHGCKKRGRPPPLLPRGRS